MPKVRELKPRKVRHNGETRWMVYVPESWNSGKRKRLFFAEKADAGAECQKWNSNNAPLDFWRLSDAERATVFRCLARIGYDVAGLERAIDLYRAHKTTDKPLQDAIRECLEAKSSGNRRPNYVGTTKSILTGFAVGRETRMVSSVTSAEIQEWLNAKRWAMDTKLGAWTRLRTFFRWCQKRQYCSGCPTDSVERPLRDPKPPGILTVEQATKLMKTARVHDPGLIGVLALSLFAGLRPSEAAAVGRAQVRRDHVEVLSTKVRSRRRRFVTVNPTLKAWLGVPGVELPPGNLRRRLRVLKKLAGIPWPHDCLRHSFASYHLAQHRDAARTAHEMGDNQETVFAHYRELVSAPEAAKFWGIGP